MCCPFGEFDFSNKLSVSLCKSPRTEVHSSLGRCVYYQKERGGREPRRDRLTNKYTLRLRGDDVHPKEVYQSLLPTIVEVRMHRGRTVSHLSFGGEVWIHIRGPLLCGTIQHMWIWSMTQTPLHRDIKKVDPCRRVETPLSDPDLLPLSLTIRVSWCSSRLPYQGVSLFSTSMSLDKSLYLSCPSPNPTLLPRDTSLVYGTLRESNQS